MLLGILVILIILYFLGYLQIPALMVPDFPLFVVNNHTVTLWDVLILAVIAWAVGILPSPFRQIAGVILVLWILSTLGFLAIAGLSHLLVIALIAGIIIALLD